MSQPNSAEQLRSQILELVRQYHAAAFPGRDFIPGQSPVPCAARVFGAEEIVSLVDCSLDFWLTSGRFTEEFEKRLANFFGIRHCLLVNSGSSANLLALSALTSPKLGEDRLRPGDEVITVAAGFPTTVNPIIQNAMVPVFVDIQLPTYNIDVSQLEAALSPRTRAIMVAHTLGNPFDLKTVCEFAEAHDLWLIEDCCDALGATYHGRHVGTFGDLATCSFYPAHHITMGEGGAVLTHSPRLKSIVESFRDLGRDCWCPTGVDNTCGKRFAWQIGDLPHGYDHKYIYSHIGYNMKATDMQAAVGVAQLDRLLDFISARRSNFNRLYNALQSYEEYFIFAQATAHAEPSWFGFPLTVRPGAPFTRNELGHHLVNVKIGIRQFFAGNLTLQPAYRDVNYRIIGNLINTDTVMNHNLWTGVYPGLNDQMIDYTANQIMEFVDSKKQSK
ncbi:MAG: lipopolysaccharide biosynthesis protein RfbH [Isosphaeraceae bacterium]